MLAGGLCFFFLFFVCVINIGEVKQRKVSLQGNILQFSMYCVTGLPIQVCMENNSTLKPKQVSFIVETFE